MKKVIVLSLILGLIISGCGNEEDKQNDKVEEISKNVGTQTVSQEETKNPNETDNTLSEKTDRVKNAAGDLVTAIQNTALPVVEKTKEKTEELVETVKESSTALIENGLDATTQLTENATEMVKGIGEETGGIAPTSILVLENKKGNVSFSHKTHIDSVDCVKCHGTEAPGPIALGKEKGHDLCQGCHKENKAGPTKCGDCHEKKPTAAVEGC